MVTTGVGLMTDQDVGVAIVLVTTALLMQHGKLGKLVCVLQPADGDTLYNSPLWFR